MSYFLCPSLLVFSDVSVRVSWSSRMSLFESLGLLGCSSVVVQDTKAASGCGARFASTNRVNIVLHAFLSPLFVRFSFDHCTHVMIHIIFMLMLSSPFNSSVCVVICRTIVRLHFAPIERFMYNKRLDECKKERHFVAPVNEDDMDGRLSFLYRCIS